MQSDDSRLINLGILRFINDSKKYKEIIHVGNKILGAVEQYRIALHNDDDVLRKLSLHWILEECKNDAPYRDVANYLSSKLIGKDYFSLFHMKMHKEI